MFYTKLKEPCSFQMVPLISFLISSGSRKKEPRYVCLSEAKASLRHKILMSSGSKKGTQLSFLLSQKPRQKNPFQVPQKGPYEREARPQGTLHISKKKPIFQGPLRKSSPKAPSTELL
jgi:hypothetical protein